LPSSTLLVLPVKEPLGVEVSPYPSTSVPPGPRVWIFSALYATTIFNPALIKQKL
jgi:hypothetical protein